MNYIYDVPLKNLNDEHLSINVVIEICPGTSDKMELVDTGFNELKCVRQVIGQYPFYYGSFPQTYAGDRDPLDFILFTDKDHQSLDLVKVDVIGAIRTIDEGEQDDKILCVECDCGLLNLKKHLKKALKFLKRYKGKNADMVISKKLASMREAEALVDEAHEAWKERLRPRKTSKINSAATQANNTRVRVIRRK